MQKPEKDLRSIGRPDPKPEDEGLSPLNVPEPLVIPPEQLVENYKRLIEEEADRQYLHVAELVKVESIGQILGFMSHSMDVYKRARLAPGFVAGGIRAKWWRKSFWAYLIWEDETYWQQFVNSPRNASINTWVQQHAGPGSCFVTWVSKGEPDWKDAMAHLEHPSKYYRDPWMR